ncbi:MAG: hypothetical protein M0R68_14950, partial [Bacteroidetes bacterium]|nr:hypothetical protein [Bacteroidota bacterium]
VFDRLALERKTLINAVDQWTWKNYSLKHLELWEYLLAKKNGKTYRLPAVKHQDGVFSIMEYQSNEQQQEKSNITIYRHLLSTYIQHKVNYIRNIIRRGEVKATLKKINVRRIRNFFFKY